MSCSSQLHVYKVSDVNHNDLQFLHSFGENIFRAVERVYCIGHCEPVNAYHWFMYCPSQRVNKTFPVLEGKAYKGIVNDFVS